TEPTEPPAAPELSAETANGSVANLTWTAPEGARSYTVLRTMTTNAGAQFNSPMDVAVAADGTIYVADSSNHRIRKIAPDGTVTTLAGSSAGYVDGTGAAAKFVQPRGLAIGPDGNVYVADTGNHRIRKVTPDGVVTTVAGTGVNSFADGAAKTAAKFSNPWDVVVAGDGTIYVADYGNYRVRKITTAGAVSTLAGTATKG
ncbi:SMP-30/gluconolactonase/LRE family protein, partial [bacterium]|nr:SMP-30/gluconolactonase/LRE family protein [bacterium]